MINKVKRWIKGHPKTSIFSGIFILIFIAVAFLSVSQVRLGGLNQQDAVMKEGALESKAADYGASPSGGASSNTQRSPEFEVKTGDAHIESEDADSEVSKLRSELSRFNGNIKEERRDETRRQLTYTLDVRVSSEHFGDFVEWLKDNYEVTDANLHYETVTMDETYNEIMVLEQSRDIYEDLIQRVRSREVTLDQVELLDELSEKKLDVARDLNDLGYDIAQLEEQEQRSEVEITFSEQLEFSVWPEDVGNDIRDEVRAGMNDLIETTATVSRVPMDIASIFLRAVRYALLGIAFLLPFVIAFLLLRGGYRRFIK